MPRQWSGKRERQYEHVRSSAKQRGASERRSKEIAARTVNKSRAQSGESTRASRTSVRDMPPSVRGGKRSGRPGPRGRTREQLYAEAKRRGIRGRSRMNKSQLEKALRRH
jgi:hypothetical protein